MRPSSGENTRDEASKVGQRPVTIRVTSAKLSAQAAAVAAIGTSTACPIVAGSVGGRSSRPPASTVNAPALMLHVTRPSSAIGRPPTGTSSTSARAGREYSKTTASHESLRNQVSEERSDTA